MNENKLKVYIELSGLATEFMNKCEKVCIEAIKKHEINDNEAIKLTYDIFTAVGKSAKVSLEKLEDEILLKRPL